MEEGEQNKKYLTMSTILRFHLISVLSTLGQQGWGHRGTPTPPKEGSPPPSVRLPWQQPRSSVLLPALWIIIFCGFLIVCSEGKPCDAGKL